MPEFAWKMSEVWKQFSKLTDREAKCNLCAKIVKSSGNTTNLKKHLATKHDSAENPTALQKNTLNFEKIAVNRSNTDGDTLTGSDSTDSIVYIT